MQCANSVPDCDPRGFRLLNNDNPIHTSPIHAHSDRGVVTYRALIHVPMRTYP